LIPLRELVNTWLMVSVYGQREGEESIPSSLRPASELIQKFFHFSCALLSAQEHPLADSLRHDRYREVLGLHTTANAA